MLQSFLRGLLGNGWSDLGDGWFKVYIVRSRAQHDKEAGEFNRLWLE